MQGQSLNHGFKLIQKKFVQEVNGKCYYFEHQKSGAKLFKIANDDENKNFAIAFKTLPESDNGVAHILEHSVLNGSVNFPVKSPFDILSQGSLNTFLNAMTSRDFTEYPIASLNEKDYFNLMHIYLDAVFYPLLLQDERILKQEGWHYELTDKEAPLTYKGVVYNEMKGAFSNPYRLLLYHSLKSLFPSNAIGKESGGLPEAIVTLTQQEFVEFHQKYYHPSNAVIFLYGNGDLDKELAFLDENYLNKFEKNKEIFSLENEKGFDKILEQHYFYPVSENSPTENQTYLSFNFVAGEASDYELSYTLNILCQILFNQESAPVKRALTNANIGQNVVAFVSDFQQNVVTILVENANPKDFDKCKTIIIETLTKEITNGIDKQEFIALFNRMEFNIREGSDSQKGINYFSLIKAGWIYANNPFSGLEYEKYLKSIKEKIDKNYIEDIVKSYFLNNQHASFIVLEPKMGLEKENQQREETELAKYKASLSEQEIEKLIKETNEFIAYQNQEDKPENIVKIPMLSINDIDTNATFYQCEVKNINKNKLLHYQEFTNNIIYSYLYFDMSKLPQELIPYASLLTNILGNVDTENFTYSELNRELNNQLGGFTTSLNAFLPTNNDTLSAFFIISSKFLNTKSSEMFKLTNEIILRSKLDNKQRLKEIFLKHLTELDAYSNDGFAIVRSRAISYFNKKGVFDEMTSGLDYYNFVNQFAKDIDSHLSKIIDNLEKVVDILFTQDNLMLSVTCDEKDYSIYKKSATAFLNLLPSKQDKRQLWSFKLVNKNEGIQSASKVQYVVKGYDFKKLGYNWNGNMRVLNQILTTDWLKNQVRVIGGAYGGYSSINPNGTFIFSSYRDPNLSKTLDIFNKTAEYVKNFAADEQTMTRFIIGTISTIDTPKTTEQKGIYSFYCYLLGRTFDEISKERDAILHTTPEDIRQYHRLIADIIEKNNICVYGNDELIEKDQKLFHEIFHIKTLKSVENGF